MVFSNLRASYSSVVQVVRLGGGGGAGRVNGAVRYTWVDAQDIIDVYWGVPGQMKCRIDCQFIMPGIEAPMPTETASRVPRRGTLYFDIPQSYTFVRAGDRIKVLQGPYEGSMFELRVTPVPAQDFFGPTHMEVELVEVTIPAATFPGVEPGSVVR